MAKKYEGKWLTPSRMRKITIGVIALLIFVSFIVHTGTGTLSGFGWDSIAAICPLGALEALLGGWSFVVRPIIALAAVLLLVFIFGRAFCAWVCPVPPMIGFFKTKKQKGRDAESRLEAGHYSREQYEAGCEGEHSKARVDSRHIVLCGALGSAAIFGFPVFCLICPIGLTFGIMLGLVRLVGFNEPSFGLLVFPAILILELTLLRSWCTKFCPISALLSLVSRFNKTFRPAVDEKKCLRHTSCDSCGVCAISCPEHIDPHSDKGLVAISECTRCGACAEACPTGALGFPFLSRHKSDEPHDRSLAVESHVEED